LLFERDETQSEKCGKMQPSLRKGAISIKKSIYWIQMVGLLSLFWVTLFESFTPVVLISAPLVSALTLYITETLLLKQSLYDLYPMNVLWVVGYFLRLIPEIYRSAILLIPLIVTGKADPEIFDIETTLEKRWEIALLANTITLTPGTITVNLEGRHLQVLWMNPKAETEDGISESIKGKFERRLERSLWKSF